MEINTNNLHHAYLVVGEAGQAHDFLKRLFIEAGFEFEGNPDFLFISPPTFGIAEAREITARAAMKPLGKKKVFLISPQKFSVEAQNALLKTFEDPFPDTHFFIVVRDEEVVIPTLFSRLQVIRNLPNLISEKSEGTTFAAKNFLSLPVKDKLTFAKEFTDEESALAPFLDNLICLLKPEATDLKKVERVYKMRRFANDRSASPRLIIEHLALVL